MLYTNRFFGFTGVSSGKMMLFMGYFLLLLLFSGCDEDETVDITVMPDATTVGANTFGCLIDGWVYVGGRYSISGFMIYHTPSISFHYYPEVKTMGVSVLVKRDKTLSFTIHNPEEGKQTVFTGARWEAGELGDGVVTITRFDAEKQIVSGRFEGEYITHGRFDVQYELREGYPYEEAEN